MTRKTSNPARSPLSMPLDPPDTETSVLTEVVLPALVEPTGLLIRSRPLPMPGRGQVLVRMEATGVSFAEQLMRRNRYPGQPKFPFVPGYDMVGTVAAVGAGVDPSVLGTRVAAVTKTGGWASHQLIDASDLLPVDGSLDPVEVETLLLNGITAWQMLHRRAQIRDGQTILIHGANGGVGSVLVELAHYAGVRVIGTAAPRHHPALATAGVVPLDYHNADLAAAVRSVAPNGVDAIFDHLGIASARQSFRLLAPGGTLVCYGNATGLNDTDSVIFTITRLLARLQAYNLAPNGRRAGFYNFWAGRSTSPRAFRTRLRHDLNEVLALLADGVITPQIAGRFRLTDAAAALQLVESRTTRGKVILTP
ncbi:medium chain dehydrogenase/reductase family protein [Amycolatopsis sp. cmx-8-4]|uniref:medium chain dehydrogenase/reductase family protein n=1 Tax=Amycolatopsis sp. cmx-8-4 TaxID=2790947 RepID=UPI00397A9D2A